MIYISEEKLDEVEYLIQQSSKGNHILFELEQLRNAFCEIRPVQNPLSEEEAYSVEPHIERILELPDLVQKRAYLDSLDPITMGQVVRTYFTMVENSLSESEMTIQ